jgi:hypothetical protein
VKNAGPANGYVFKEKRKMTGNQKFDNLILGWSYKFALRGTYAYGETQ